MPEKHHILSSLYHNSPLLNKSTGHRWSNNSQNSTSTPLTNLPLSTFEYVQICIFITAFVVSLSSNGILLLTTWKTRKNCVGGWLLVNLVIVNLLETIAVMPWNFTFFLRRNVDPFSGEATWQVLGRGIISLLFEWCTRVSWMLVALIGIDRFCVLVRTMTYHKDFPRKRAKWCFLVVAGVNSVFVIIPFIARLNADFHPWRHYCTMQRSGMYGYFAMDLITFLVPFAVMVYCWGRIFSLAWSKRLKVYIGNIASAAETDTRKLTDSIEKPNGVLPFLRRSTSRDSISSASSSSATTSRKPSASANAFVYNRSHKALTTVSLILGPFILTAGIYTVSILLEVFDNPTYNLQPWWFYGVTDCAIFVSPAIYPFTYGFLHRTVRRDVYVAVRALFGYGPVSAPPLPRRWSISSHIMDYLPVTVGGGSRAHSRRTSEDALGPHKRRRSSTSDESDTISDTSFFHNFLRVKASRRRQSAPSRLQNSVLDGSGIVLTFSAATAKPNGLQDEV